MPRVILSYYGRQIRLPYGESIIGRAVTCRIRFNDPAVSRRHVRITSTANGAFAENLSHTNPATLNKETWPGLRKLAPGDQLELGYQIVDVTLGADDQTDFDEDPVTLSGTHEVAPGLLTEDYQPEEATRPGPLVSSGSLASQLYGREDRNCSFCGAVVSRFDEACGQCGNFRPENPDSNTMEIKLGRHVRRTAPRYHVHVPVIYSSEYLTLDAVVRDISEGGMFIATELLDPVGTKCEVTVLPDGYGALRFVGEVCHASAEGSKVAGIGIRLTGQDQEAESWLQKMIEMAAIHLGQ